jgi:hypothetical protein
MLIQRILGVLFVYTLCVYANDVYRDDAKEVVIDTQQKLMWQDSYKAEYVEKSFDEARAYCQDLNFAGFTDWYLPSLRELKTIQKPDNYPQSIDKAFKHVSREYYWSASEYSDDLAWLVLFVHADVVQYHKVDANGVRCVRKLH